MTETQLSDKSNEENTMKNKVEILIPITAIFGSVGIELLAIFSRLN
jgi:hypothetical protein